MSKVVFKFKHPETGEIKYASLEVWQLSQIEGVVDDARDQLRCDCQPVGETNVIECNCEDYINDFEIVVE